VLPEDVRTALAEHLGCAENELRHRKVPARKPRTPRSQAPVMIHAVPPNEVPEGFGRVAEIDVRASAGPGAINEGF
jgi:hypothetical protein